MFLIVLGAMRSVAIIQARMTSSRLPGKVMRELCGRPVIEWVANAALCAQSLDAVWVAIPEGPAHVAIADWCQFSNVRCVAGPERDVLSRFVLAAAVSRADLIVRLTADCPF